MATSVTLPSIDQAIGNSRRISAKQPLRFNAFTSILRMLSTVERVTFFVPGLAAARISVLNHLGISFSQLPLFRVFRVSRSWDDSNAHWPSWNFTRPADHRLSANDHATT